MIKHWSFPFVAILFILTCWYFLTFSQNSAIINPDGILYFSYLCSLCFDQDLLFVNEFDRLRLIEETRYISASGLEGNHVAFGTAMLMAPFFCVLHLLSRFVPGLDAHVSYSGYNAILFNTFPLGSLVYGFLTIYLIFRLFQHVIWNKNSELPHVTLFKIVFGTMFFFYMLIFPGLSHITSAFSVTLFIYYFEKIRGTDSSSNPSRSLFILGLLIGLAIMVRTQNGLFIVLPIFHLCQYRKNNNAIREVALKALPFSLGTVLGVIPQVIIWKILNGKFLDAVESANVDFSSPHLYETLLSSYHGLFFWTPITVLACLGLIALTVHKYTIGLPYLLAFLLQLWLNSSILAWWEAVSFSMRLFTNCTAIFAIGLAYLYQCIPAIWLRVTAWLCVCWTIVLSLLFKFGRLDLNLFYSPGKIWEMVMTFLIGLGSELESWKRILVLDNPGRAFCILCVALLITILIVFFWHRLTRECSSRCSLLQKSHYMWVIWILILSLFLVHAGLRSQARIPDYRNRIAAISAISKDYSYYMTWSYHLSNAHYLQALRHYQKAEEEYLKALAMKHDLIEAYLRIGLLYYARQQHEKALTIIEEGLKNEPENSQLLQIRDQLEKEIRIMNHR
ncbi:tetratricopeptide repeat protein [bacterium]|nr:tetratricopeptide repeat protein [bacterium]